MTARPFLVAVTGGSGSGKSLFTRALAEALGRERVAILAHDAYYRDRSDLPEEERTTLDYDVPDAIDRARFVADLTRLREGSAIRPPDYCFMTHCRLGDAAAVEARPVVLVDGILLLHDPEVRALFDLTIFVDAPSLVRLKRRLGRDAIERGRSTSSVLRQFAATVAPAHARYVEPTKTLADVVLRNTSRIEPLVEVAVTLIRARLARREEESIGARAELA